MSKNLYIVVFMAFALSGCSSSSQQGPASPQDLQKSAERFLSEDPPVVVVSRPTPERWQLENGLTVLFMRDDELPLVTGSLVIPGGKLWEPPLSRGVVSTMGMMMRLGGTEELEPDALDEKLRKLAANIGSNFGDEYGGASFNSLSGDVEEVFALFRDVVQKPRFDEKRLEIVKIQALDSIKRRKEDLVDVARTTAQVLLHGYSPQSGIVTSADVSKLSRLELLRAHREFVRPNGAYLTLTGDITRAEAEALVEKNFGDWQRRATELGPPVPLVRPSKPGIYFVEGDFTQSLIFGVQPGPPRFTDDLFSIRLFNNLMGDGFDSRVVKTVRADMGLAYVVSVMTQPNFQAGKNLLYAQTKTESTLKALQATLGELEKIQRELPTAEEVSLMQQGAQSSFVFRFDSPAKVLSRQVTLEMLGYPDDYDETYIPNIFAVTPEDISASARKWWHLDELRIVIVGSPDVYQVISEGVKTDPLLSKYPLYKLEFDEVPRGAGI